MSMSKRHRSVAFGLITLISKRIYYLPALRVLLAPTPRQHCLVILYTPLAALSLHL